MSAKDKKSKQLDFPKRYDNDPWLLNLQRKVRNINKKITQAEELKAMKRDGKDMEPEQLEKIKKSAELPARIAEFQSAADEYVKCLQESKQEEKKTETKKTDSSLRNVVSLLHLGSFLRQQESRTAEQDAIVEVAKLVSLGQEGSNTTLGDSINESLKTAQQFLGKSSTKSSNGVTFAAVLEAVESEAKSSSASAYVAKETTTTTTAVSVAAVEKKLEAAKETPKVEAVKETPKVVEAKKETPVVETKEAAVEEVTVEADKEEEKVAATTTTTLAATGNWHDEDDNSVNEEEVVVTAPKKKQDDEFIQVQSKSSNRKKDRGDERRGRGGRGRGGRGRGDRGRGEARGRGNFRGHRGGRRGGNTGKPATEGQTETPAAE
eukprot:CAMPEP_0115014524 /NCGR_PEP_ID=MMETSP0216-20121206/26140_1 /TAXON_ID=223996 /ORGANISM="Protocruzia adherens, Strain Boccale" /LENGTH=377 /DNA_ID=CAMNT_0002384301 /DNA_START=47 /DNA_END=1180 /DNA_ORIENTATION=-